MTEYVFKPSQQLTFDTVQSDSQRLVNVLLDNKPKCIRLDLSEVVHCDSAGLALLIEAKRLSKQHGATLVIEKMPQAILALAEFCGVETMLEQEQCQM